MFIKFFKSKWKLSVKKKYYQKTYFNGKTQERLKKTIAVVKPLDRILTINARVNNKNAPINKELNNCVEACPHYVDGDQDTL